jgi:hypothetical protein
MVELGLSIRLAPAVRELAVPPENKKADEVDAQEVIHHVGLPGDEPPGAAGLPFI